MCCLLLLLSFFVLSANLVEPGSEWESSESFDKNQLRTINQNGGRTGQPHYNALGVH